MPVWIILLATIVYMAGLFWLAWQRDNKLRQAPNTSHNPIVYMLALAVYCTSWTYFGAVGTAASSGWDYLPIYLGPALVFLFLPKLLRKIGDIVERESITSLSDFLAARYGKSRALAACASLAAVTGSLPYIALQLKSVGMSFMALAQTDTPVPIQTPNDTVLSVTIILAGFAILFGARRSDTTTHNPGLMYVLAFEAVFKIVALIAVCVLSLFLLGSVTPEHGDLFKGTFAASSVSNRFITITFLAIAAIICLPRQFHVAMIERRNICEMLMARYLFPLYMLVTSLVVVPITLAGLSVLPSSSSPDLFVINLPLAQGENLLALIVFLGGLSAASGMVIVSTIALSTMVTNDLLVPALMRFGRFDSVSGEAGARLLLLRRIVILLLLLLAYGYYRLAGNSDALAQIGLLSFAAAAQFLPALIGAVYWRTGKAAGAITGLVIGMGVWVYTLFLPALIGHAPLASLVPTYADPYALLGISFGDSLTHGVLWSFGANVFFFLIISLRMPERLRDRVQAAVFLGDRGNMIATGGLTRQQAASVTPDDLRALAARFLSVQAVEHAFEELATSQNITVRGAGKADWHLIQRTEKLLASALGASSARVVLASAIGGMDVTLPDVLSILDQGTQAERFDRHMLQSMLENIEHGISVVDHEQKLTAWNSAYIQLFDYPHKLVQVGQPIAPLIAHNLNKGWIDGDLIEQADKRIAHMRSGRVHNYERRIPNGRHLRISGNPMPGGGYVTTFIDITKDKIREKQLLNANDNLESRVKSRTQALEKMAADLDEARLEAEGANISKTRFLAAASHDLLQPLNAARLFLGALKEETEPKNSHRQGLIAKTEKAVQSADELLKGLLDISRLDHGKVTANPVTLPLGPLLEDLVDEATPMAKRAGLEISLVPTHLSVRADAGFLQSILRNFISNARRYTVKGRILIGARRRGDQARIEIWDTGPGIAEDKLPGLFKEFERLNDVDNIGIRGAGLGLSIAHRLADIIGGQIEVKSWPGLGSVFALSCPLAKADRVSFPNKTSPREIISHRPLNLRVLCVDDEAIILQGMQSLLEGWGCDVLLAQSPDDLQDIADYGDIDVVIADYDLKHKQTGLDVIGTVRQHLKQADNAILISAKSTRQEVWFQDEGAHFLKKPVDPQAIKDFLLQCQARLLN